MQSISKKCQWVIISNFDEIRLYHRSDSNRYESFLFSELLIRNPQEKQIAKQYPNLPKFFYLLYFGQLFNALEQNTEAAIPLTEKLYKGRIKRLEEITNQFYQSYRKLKDKLQVHIQEKNKQQKLSHYQSFHLAHQIFNKLIFIRFAEEIELANRKSIYDFWTFLKVAPTREPLVWYALRSIFTSFDEGYNSQIPPFNGELFKPVPLLAKITIENEILREILNFLLSYDFKNELKVDILGHIFEQSINDIAAAKATEEAVAVTVARKRDGVFYTPEFITDYMIREKTVIAYLNKQKFLIYRQLDIDFISEFDIDFQRWQQANPALTHKQASEKYAIFFADYQQVLENIKILDPACGSGAFLTRTYDILLKEWEIVYDESKKSSENLYEVLVNEAKTQTTAKKKTSNIDMFEVGELAKKRRNKDLFQIGKNILLNNLFGVDLSTEAVEITKLSLWLKTDNNQNITLANLENNIKQGNSLIENKSVDENAFIWEKEFPQIFTLEQAEKRGFDVIIGNPPYVAKTKDSIYKNYDWNTDLYLMFFEKSLKNLLKSNGTLGFITPCFWLVNQNCKDFRQFMLTQVEISKLVETSPFEDANTECTIVICENKKSVEDEILVFENVKDGYFYTNAISKTYALSNPYIEILTHLNQEKIDLLNKIEKNTLPLKNIVQSKRGMEIGKSELRNQVGIKTLIGQDTKRYMIDFEHTFVNANEHEYNRLRVFFEETDLYLRRVANRLIAATADEKYAFNKNIYGLKIINSDFEKYYLLALLNSKLLDFCYKNKFSTKKVDLFPEIQTYLFEALPIKSISQTDQQQFVEKVKQLLQLNPITASDVLQKIDNEIDSVIYELYEILPTEVALMEG